MNNLRNLVCSIIVVLLVVLGFVMPTLAATVTFQEGAAGYSGCSDSFVSWGPYNGGTGSIFGKSTDILVGYGETISF